MPVGSTSQHSVQDLGFTDIGLLTLLCCLYPLPVRQASVLPSASFRFHLAMDTLAVRLTLPLAGCVEDFHLQVKCALPGAPKQKPLIRAARKIGNYNRYFGVVLEPADLVAAGVALVVAGRCAGAAAADGAEGVVRAGAGTPETAL